MARLDREGVAGIYDLHHRWMTEVLGPGDSLLTPGSPVWTEQHLDELETDFVGKPELTKDKRFLEKLHDQLAHVSPEAVQLMAELHVVHFLIIWNGAISAAKKRSDLEAILSWMPHPSAIPAEVAAAMAPGLVHPGQWVMARRDTQLRWLIRFSRAWKDATEERRGEFLSDPWAMKAFAESIQTPASDGARLALLHLAHPDTFEAIVSPDHKQFIVGRFDEPASGDDVDRRLLAARAALTDEYGPGFDWYEDPLVHRWLRDRKAWPAFLGWLKRFRALDDFDEEERLYKIELAERLRHARKLVLEGDNEWLQGLRATFTDRSNNLTQWQDHDRFLKWLEEEPALGLQALVSLWQGSEAALSRLAAFYDAVPSSALGPPGERLNIGTFLLMAEDPTALPPMKISVFRSAWKLANWGPDKDLDPTGIYKRALVFVDEVVRDGREWAEPLRDRLDAQGAIWALVKGKTKPESWPEDLWKDLLAYRSSAPTLDAEDESDLAAAGEADDPGALSLVDHIAAAAEDLHIDRAVLDEIVELLEDKGQVVLYGPPGTGKTYLALRLARAITAGDADRMALVQFHPATSYEDFFEGLRPEVTDAGQVTYRRTDGPLVIMADKAAADPRERTHVLVIDEINRANLPKVFGELLFLLEYRSESAC